MVDSVQEPVATETFTDWSGFYVGAQLGGGFGNSGTFALTPFAGALPGAFAPGFDGEFDAGVVGGVHIGYDQQYNNFVFGGILDVSATDLGDIQQGFSTTPAAYNIERDLDYLATLRARIGYTVTPDMLLYATGGLAYGDVDFNYSQPGSGAATTTAGGQNSHFGYVVGAGVEKMVTEKVSFGVEYLYTNLGGNDFSATLVGGPFGTGTTATGTDENFDFHTVQLKLSYRF